MPPNCIFLSFFLAQKDRHVATKTQPRDTQDPIQRQHIRSNLMLGTLENRQRGWPLATAATGGDCSVKAYLAGPRLDENCWAVLLPMLMHNWKYIGIQTGVD